MIDFCLVRHLVCDQDTNYQSLRLTWASKTNCNQRRGTNRTHLTFKICASFSLCALLLLFYISGRAGRVLKGNCYRLVTKEFWRNEILDHMIPDMLVRKCRQIFLFPIFLFFLFSIPVRAMRTIPFLCFTVTSYFTSSQLAPLATIMLKVKLLDIGDPHCVLSTALSPPNISDIVKTVLQLKEVNA